MRPSVNRYSQPSIFALTVLLSSSLLYCPQAQAEPSAEDALYAKNTGAKTTDTKANSAQATPAAEKAAIMVPISSGLTVHQQVIEHNNQGVRLLRKGYFKEAIDMLSKALTLEPTYQNARVNLAIAQNNLGLQIAATDKEKALNYFASAILLDGSNKTTRENVDGIIRKMGKDPNSYQDRIALGDKLRAAGLIDGAKEEYRSAMLLSDRQEAKSKYKQVASIKTEISPFIRAPLAKAPSDTTPENYLDTTEIAAKWQERPHFEYRSTKIGVSVKLTKEGSQVDDTKPVVQYSSGVDALDKYAKQCVTKSLPLQINGHYDPAPKTIIFNAETGTVTTGSLPAPDYTLYLSNAERTMKSNWHPPKCKQTERVKVRFAVNSVGKISDVKIVEAPDNEEIKKAAMAAVTTAGDLPPLPMGSISPINVEFTFDYNLLAK